MTVRHQIDVGAQVLADFNTLKSVAASVLEAEYAIPPGQTERVHDIAASLARVSPGLPSDVALLAALGQNQAARDAVAAGLLTLKSIDPHLFDASPTVKRLALIQVIALGAEDFESLLHNAERDGVDIRRRTWHQMCLRLIAEGRGDEIPTDAQSGAQPNPEPPGQLGGVSSSRVSFPRRRGPIDGQFAWKPLA